MDIAGPFLAPGRGVTLDNFFTSKALGGELLKTKTTLLGTIRKNRVEVFRTKNTNHRDEGSSEYKYSGDFTILSHKPTFLRNITAPATERRRKGRRSHKWSWTTMRLKVKVFLCHFELVWLPFLHELFSVSYPLSLSQQVAWIQWIGKYRSTPVNERPRDGPTNSFTSWLMSPP